MRRIQQSLSLLLLIAFPIAWAAPLMRAGLLPFFGGTEISILSGIRTLYGSDPALALLVAVLALVAPYGKILALEGIRYGVLGASAKPFVTFMGRVAMADIFLIAVYIVVVKGVGLGRVETAWGLWLFTACVGLSLMMSWMPIKR